MQSKYELPAYPPLFIVRFFNAVRKRLVRISRRFTHPGVVMLEHMQNLWLLGSISVANELGIAGILNDGPMTISELARLTETYEDPLYRVMRLLASEGIFREIEGKKFANTRYSEPMLETELKYFIRHTLNKIQFRAFGEMMHTLKTGRRTTELFFEQGVFDHMGQSQEINDLYNRAMTNTSRMQIAAILSSYDFRRYRHIIDIGGGQGLFISSILARYEGLRGTLFDLPQVVGRSFKLPGSEDFKDRLTITSGSFFEMVPEGGDLYMLKNILHGWADNECIEILENIRKAMAENGRVMIIESLIGKMNKPSWGKMTDIFMMAGLGGKERTVEEFLSILDRSGFRLEKIKHTVSPLSLIIGVPTQGK